LVDVGAVGAEPLVRAGMGLVVMVGVMVMVE
jgi:hypothetical protein